MERTLAAGGSRGVSQYGPIAVETREFRRPVTPVAHPKAKLLLVRDGEATITPAQYRGAVRDHDIHVVDHDRFPEQ